MTQNVWFALPSLTALLIQAWVFIRSDKRCVLKDSKPLAFLFFGLVGISAIEFGTYTNLLLPSLIVMKLFYVSCFLGITGIFLQAIKISGISSSTATFVNKVAIISFLFLSILMIGTEQLVSGFGYISYSYTRVPGNFYWLVQLFLGSLSLLSILVLLAGTKNEKETDARRSKVLLVSISPLLIFAVILIALMQLGIQMNASVVFPLFIAYFLLVVLQTESDESLFSLLMRVPFSKERESLNQITTEIQKFLIETELSHKSSGKQSALSLKSLTNSIENIIVEHAVKLNNGSQIKAATLLGVSSSSICRKKNKV